MTSTTPPAEKGLTSESFWSARIIGVNIPIYLALLAVPQIAVLTEIMPSNIVSGLSLTVILGGGLKWIGDRTPGIANFGGGSLLCILVPTLLLYLGAFPQSFADLADAFYNGGAATLVTVSFLAAFLM